MATPLTPSPALAIFVVGGPGAGKRTHSSRLAHRFALHYISIGDLLWEEQSKPESPHAEEVRVALNNGDLARTSIVIELLATAIQSARFEETSGYNGFLISGFPRRLEELGIWEERFASDITLQACLFLDCPESIMKERMPLRRNASRVVEDVEKQRMTRLEGFRNHSGAVIADMSKRGILRKVNSSSYDVEAVWASVQEVMWPVISQGTNLWNQAIVVVKPHAVNDETIRYIQSFLIEHGITVCRKGEARDKGRIFNAVYQALVHTSTVSPPSLTITRKEKLVLFEDSMGLSWDDAIAQGSVKTPAEAMTLLQVSATDLNALWDEADHWVQLGRALYVAQLDYKGKPIYVVNGFIPFYREKFVDVDMPAVWLVVRFDPRKLNWKDMCNNIIGTTNPATASLTSIRRQLFEHWRAVGLSEAPTTTNNCVHFSGGPLESIREHLLWTGMELTEELTARQILARGVPIEFLEGLLENPYVTGWAGSEERVPVFDATAACDVNTVIIDAVAHARENCGEAPSWWAVSSSSKLETAPPSSPIGASLPKCMTILHFNDVYNIEPLDSANPKGGIARFVTRIRELKAEPTTQGEAEALILFSGDALSPSLISTVTLGEHMIPALNAIGIEAAVYGNHEFDFGVDHLRKLAGQTNFPWLLSNATDAETGKPLGDGLLTMTIDFHGRKLGLIGLIEKEWLVTLATLEMGQVNYEDFVTCGRRLAKELKEERGADVVIALTHMRTPNDERLASEVEEIDIILGGHDHHYEVKPVGPWGTYVLNSGTDFRDITRVRLEFHDGFTARACSVTSTEHIEIGAEIEEDPAMHELVQKYKRIVGEAMDEVLGYTAVDLDARFTEIRTKETNIGNFITDVMRRKLKCDCVVLNSGTLRADSILEHGELKLRHLLNLLPMVDELCVLELSGKQLLQVLENGVSQWPRLEGRFLQVSGVVFKWNSNQPGGQRVLEDTVEVAGQLLEQDKVYTVGTKDYLRKGKDGFDVFAECKCIAGGEESGVLTGLLRDLFKNLQALNGFTSEHSSATAAIAAGLKDFVRKFGDGPEPLQRWGIHPSVEGRIVRVE